MRNIWLVVMFGLLFVPAVQAAEMNQFITVVNPVRLSSYNLDPVASLKAQSKIILKHHLPATWLLTYDVLAHPQVMAALMQMAADQEMGIFLEVTPAFAQSAGVTYHQTGDWHNADSIFLSGYSRSDRIKLIQTVFAKFKDQFGYYPTSIGSWWIDAYSLRFIKEEYNVTANLGVADQYQTDGYQVWGQYWSTPFYPSSNHPAVPATTNDSKLDLVTLQWAARDPYHGYQNSLYSTQDYFTAPNLDIHYFSKLVDLYASRHSNKFGQITVGLEGDFPASVYSGNFAQQMTHVEKLVSTGNYSAVTMSQFSNWYRSQFPDLSPEHMIASSDLLGGPTTAVWWQSPQYRVGLVIDNSKKIIKLIDLRVYSNSIVDPYDYFANGNEDLFINVPAAVDMIGKPGSEIDLNLGDIKSVSDIDFLHIAQQYSQPVPQELEFRDYALRIPYAFRSRLGNVSNTVSVVFVTSLLALAFKFFRPARLIILISIIIYLIYSGRTVYFVSQAEIVALNYLREIPEGKVMVYDKDCLRCNWTSSHQPAALANKRDYVEKISKHKLVYNDSFLTARDSGHGKLILKKNKIRYLYLVKYGDYIEATHFSPVDLNLSKIFENANAVIWKFNEDFD